MTAPVVMVGLDACDHELVWRWAGEGRLPAFARLIEGAASCRLTSSCRALQGSVWPTFATGRDPGHHGMYYMLQPAPGGGLRRARAEDFRCPPFWAGLSARGRRTVVLDVPKLGLVPGMDGAQVVEWGAMDHYSRFSTSPPDLAAGLLREFGRHPLLRELDEPATEADCRALRDRLVAGAAAKGRLGLALLERQRPDLFISVFGESHPAGHYLWRFHESGAGDLADALFQVYAALDRAVGETVARCAGAANLIVFSGHGMGRDDYPWTLTDDVLTRLGLTVRTAAPTAAGGPGPSPVKRLERAARRLASKRLLPAAVRQRRWLRNLEKGIDVARSRAWALPTDLQGFVRVNLRGREPGGVVAPGDYDAVLDQVAAAFHGLVDADSGAPVAETVFRTRDLYAGAPHLDALPDLCVQWRNAPVAAVRGPGLDTFAVPPPPGRRSGNHRPEGFALALGPDIDSAGSVGLADLRDLAPTALALLGADGDSDLPGRVLPFARGRPA